MNYSALLDLATDLGYELAMCGAETFRVEESINRVLSTYGVTSEVFSIPNCLIVSIETPDGELMTRMRRIGYHGNDLDGIACLNAICRAICNRKPSLDEARSWLDHHPKMRRSYPAFVELLGNALGSFGFAVFFGASGIDAVLSAICGLVVGLIGRFMGTMKTNPFFKTITSSFIMAFLAYAMAGVGLASNVDAVIIGALMILVPGLLFTNAMRDIIYGDTNSGVNRIVQVLLIAMAIALGTAAAWGVTAEIWPHREPAAAIVYNGTTQCVVCCLACVGFAILFNVHDMGLPLCGVGATMTWAVYLIAMNHTGNLYVANFWAAAAAAAYAEIIARLRKCPASSYLVVSLFPLLPGAGIYYTMSYALEGSVNAAVHKGLETAAIAGVMAVGILLISTAARASRIWKAQRIA